MNKIKRSFAWLTDQNVEFMDRIFVLLTLIAECGVILGLIGDIIYHENIIEIITLCTVLIAVPGTTFVCEKKGNIHLATRIIVVALVFVIMPAMFIFGGGVEGGGVLWVIFSYLYIGLVLTGAWRVVMLISLTLMTIAGFALEYFYPELIPQHTRGMFYIDSIISLITVGMVCCIMVWFQNRLFHAENRRAKEETARAEELNRAQNRFFSSMSHEIRTPINSILGLNEIILRQEDASDEIIRDAGNIQGAGRMLLSLINDILDFSKLEAGSMDIIPVDYRVSGMMSEIVNMIWLRASEKGLKFNVEIDPQVPSVLFGDEVRIKQILINLLNNAVKYTQSGAIGLYIESEPVGEGRVLLKMSVSDTGMGIKQEALPFLFDAFRRVDQEKNRHIEGTGLGLSIVKQLVDLMGGTVTVNSVYTQGSTFTVNIEQGVSDARAVGDINITNVGAGAEHRRREQRFSAPEARVLIVDDNEMNLEVESKLLGDTDMTVETALSGAEALEKTLRTRYDVILMDHLMPEMDRIECLEKIRNQSGGLNRSMPVIVLTANAGSENRELYNAAGFDGCLVKPVSGRQLEDMLLRHLPEEKVVRTENDIMAGEGMSTAKGYSRKTPVLITASSICDLPESLIRQLELNTIPGIIRTDNGSFRDGVEMDADELLRFLDEDRGSVDTAPPTTAEFVEFFGAMLQKTHHVIHIALTSSMSGEYEHACEAAKSFGNVTIVNSECLSSSMGLLVLLAYKLARQNRSVERIVEELEAAKKNIRCSFILRSTEYMARRGYIGKRANSMVRALELRPCLRVKNNKFTIGGVWMGDLRRCYDRFISRVLNSAVDPDPGILFFTYVGVPEEELERIEARIRSRFQFDHIVFQQASSAISVNCGPGTIGLHFLERGTLPYGIGTLLPEERETEEETAEEPVPRVSSAAAFTQELGEMKTEETPEETPEGEDAWLAEVPEISYGEAIRNCGGTESFRKALELFCASAGAKADEIEGYWRGGDIKNYTVKVHALKSSARLIGALGLSKRAKELEDAGNAGDTAGIDEKTPMLLELLRGLSEKLDRLRGGAAADDRPDIGADKLAEAFASLAECAEMMDYDMAESALNSLKAYRLPPEDAKRVDAIRAAAVDLDWERVAELCGR